MNVWQSIFFGLIQGFTEFLPVSSSGHLLLVSALTGVECPLFMSVMLHVGTLFAVIIAYRKPLLQILRHPISDKRLLYLVIASIPTFIIAAAVKFFLPEGVDKYILPVGFALTAALLLLSSLNKNKFSVGEKGVLPLLITGVAQGMACFAGLSRSGATICTMSLFDIKREESGEFSFLLSIPVILAGAAVELIEAFATSAEINWGSVSIGVVAAFSAGLLAIGIVQKALKNADFKWFALYMPVPFLLSLLVL